MNYIVIAVFSSVVTIAAPNEVIADTAKKQVDTIRTTSTETSVNRTEDIVTQAKRWRLNVSDYQRYVELMKGPLGKWNPAIDPLLALGMFAESPQQRQRYAELYAQQEFDFTERVLQFQQAYRNAFDRLYPNVEMLDHRLLAPYFLHQQQKSEEKASLRLARKRFIEGDRLLIFVPVSCGQCMSVISQLMGLLSGINTGGLDIYVRDAEDNAAVREWGHAHNIKTSWLKTQRLTLNRDEGLFQQLVNQSSVPSSTALPVFLHRDKQIYQLSAGDLGL